jgi:hypothetical protein
MAEPMVPVYDCDTTSITRIPTRELAPRDGPARLPGRDGEVWIDDSQVRQGV